MTNTKLNDAKDVTDREAKYEILGNIKVNFDPIIYTLMFANCLLALYVTSKVYVQQQATDLAKFADFWSS
jgi:hypothetical protein